MGDLLNGCIHRRKDARYFTVIYHIRWDGRVQYLQQMCSTACLTESIYCYHITLSKVTTHATCVIRFCIVKCNKVSIWIRIRTVALVGTHQRGGTAMLEQKNSKKLLCQYEQVRPQKCWEIMLVKCWILLGKCCHYLLVVSFDSQWQHTLTGWWDHTTTTWLKRTGNIQ